MLEAPCAEPPLGNFLLHSIYARLRSPVAAAHCTQHDKEQEPQLGGLGCLRPW